MTSTSPSLAQSEKEDSPSYTYPKMHPQRSSPTTKIILAPPSPIGPPTNGLPSPPASNHSHESPDSPTDASRHGESSGINIPTVSSPANSAVPEQHIRVSAHAPKVSTFSVIASTSSSPIASSSALASPEPGPSSTLPHKASKFRHVPLRKPRAPVPSSPLALASQELHARTNSTTSLPPPRQGLGTTTISFHPNQSEPQLPVAPPQKAASPLVSPNLTERTLPPLSPAEPEPKPVQKPVVPVISSSLASSPPVSNKSSPSSEASTKIQNPPAAPGYNLNTSRSLTPNRLSVPYRPGFQPKGVYRHLTDDFLALRKLKRDGASENGGMKRVEREKLRRRLEKLIALHFPVDPPFAPPRSSVNTSGSAKRRPGPGTSVREVRRTSSIFDLDTLKSINLRDASDLWKNVLTGKLGDSATLDIRG